MKLLHDRNPERLVLRTVRGFFDILIGFFAIYLVSLLIKMLPIRTKSEAIGGDPFLKPELPHMGL